MHWSVHGPMQKRRKLQGTEWRRVKPQSASPRRTHMLPAAEQKGTVLGKRSSIHYRWESNPAWGSWPWRRNKAIHWTKKKKKSTLKSNLLNRINKTNFFLLAPGPFPISIMTSHFPTQASESQATPQSSHAWKLSQYRITVSEFTMAVALNCFRATMQMRTSVWFPSVQFCSSPALPNPLPKALNTEIHEQFCPCWYSRSVLW